MSIFSGGLLRYRSGGGFPGGLVFDWVIFATMSSLVSLPNHRLSFYYGLFSLFLFTMLLVVTSNNIIMMWVAVEATTLGSAFLVGIYGQRSSLEAAWKYVIICTVGVAFGLYGTILVYSDAVNFLQEPGAAVLWTEIVQNAKALDPTLLKLAFVFVLIGFGTKAGIFPMHAWLPDAHSEAPSPVSALLSAVLLNCALLVVIRFSIILNQGIGPDFTQNIFLVFGALSVAASALFMFVQRDIKRLLAYSSVENIGLIVLGFGIGRPGRDPGCPTAGNQPQPGQVLNVLHFREHLDEVSHPRFRQSKRHAPGCTVHQPVIDGWRAGAGRFTAVQYLYQQVRDHQCRDRFRVCLAYDCVCYISGGCVCRLYPGDQLVCFW